MSTVKLLVCWFDCLGADTVRFKAEINFDGREVARVHVSRLDLEKMLKVLCNEYSKRMCIYACTL